MASFSSSAPLISAVHVRDLPAGVQAGISSLVKSLTITGEPSPGGPITITVVGGSSWVQVPSSCNHNVPFNVQFLPAEFGRTDAWNPRTLTDTLRFTYSDYTPLDVPVEVELLMGGPPET